MSPSSQTISPVIAPAVIGVKVLKTAVALHDLPDKLCVH
jgi:hypothetical protein